jgi:hypothetical protein
VSRRGEIHCRLRSRRDVKYRSITVTIDASAVRRNQQRPFAQTIEPLTGSRFVRPRSSHRPGRERGRNARKHSRCARLPSE